MAGDSWRRSNKNVIKLWTFQQCLIWKCLSREQLQDIRTLCYLKAFISFIQNDKLSMNSYNNK